MFPIFSGVGPFLLNGPRCIIGGLAQFVPAHGGQLTCRGIRIHNKVEDRGIVPRELAELRLVHDRGL